MYGAADVALCLADPASTEEVVWGAHTTRAYFDQPGAQVLDGYGASNEYTLTLGAAALPGIKRGDAITVAGQGFTVAERHLIEDGALQRLTLRRA